MVSSAPETVLRELPHDTDIRAAFDAFPAQHREVLLEMRALVLDVAAGTQGVGQITETLKWAQPSYAPVRKNVGSSVRLGISKSGRPALFFICHSGLVDRFRELYDDELEFEGNRAILLSPGKQPPEAALGHCIALALSWHLAR